VLTGHLQDLGSCSLVGVALGLPGPSDYEHGISLARHKYASLYGLNIRQMVQALLPDPTLPVLFRNDAEAAIVGEAVYGVGDVYRRLIGVTLGTGLGSAFVAGGVAQRSGPTVPPDGELYVFPYHGRPADDIFSIRGLRARFHAAQLAMTDIKAAAEQARAGNAAVLSVFSQFGSDLGEFLQPFVERFTAEAVILLGGIANTSDLFIEAMQSRLSVPVVEGRLGTSAALLGAAALFFAAPTKPSPEPGSL
ncbi:MAG: ROK family protein, partial [Acidobacteria bacterium]|nr:ROK family protein [Acidobacteriota bacterium]